MDDFDGWYLELTAPDGETETERFDTLHEARAVFADAVEYQRDHDGGRGRSVRLLKANPDGGDKLLRHWEGRNDGHARRMPRLAGERAT